MNVTRWIEDPSIEAERSVHIGSSVINAEFDATDGFDTVDGSDARSPHVSVPLAVGGSKNHNKAVESESIPLRSV